MQKTTTAKVATHCMTAAKIREKVMKKIHAEIKKKRYGE